VDIGKLVQKLFELSDIDLTTLQLTDRERMVREIASPLQALQQPGAASGAGPGAQAMGDAAKRLGVSK
jgi:hypothetical protein